MTFRTQAFIDGKYCPGAIGKTYTSVNPGFFGRDKSSYAQEQYTELKTVWMQLRPEAWP